MRSLIFTCDEQSIEMILPENYHLLIFDRILIRFQGWRLISYRKHRDGRTIVELRKWIHFWRLRWAPPLPPRGYWQFFEREYFISNTRIEFS